MRQREQVAHGLATAMLAGPWTDAALTARTARALGRPKAPRWVQALTGQVLAAYRDPPTDRPRELAAYLQTCPAWRTAWQHRRPPRIVAWTPVPTQLVRRRWPVAELPDHGALARLLDVDQGELAWFADVRSQERYAAGPLRHYRWSQIVRPSGVRLVAAPKPRLKEIQRRLLRHVLDPIPLHDAAHGCVPGRSVRTAVASHAGATVVIRVDLEAFFPSVRAGRVWNLLREAGLPEGVAHTVTGLLTTTVPVDVLRASRSALLGNERSLARLRTPHLPTGAPTSPAAANVIAYSLDRRLSALAARFGAQYTRYVDDLTFSGGPSLRGESSRFVALVREVVHDEGFAVNERKTVVLGDSGRQAVLGAVVNDHPTVPRPERDALRALLHNCAVHGWRSQAREHDDFRAHVLGRISWVTGLNPVHGARLRSAFDRIDWT